MSRGGPPRARPLRSGGASGRVSRRGSGGGGAMSGAGRAVACGGGLGVAGTSGAGVGRRVTETSPPSGRPIRSPRDSRSLDPRLAGGAGAALGVGSALGVGRGAAAGPVGGTEIGGGSTSLTRSGLSTETGFWAANNSRPRTPAWTRRETASDLLKTDWRITPRRFVFLRSSDHLANRLYGTIP
jgi:hypothetical protein